MNSQDFVASFGVGKSARVGVFIDGPNLHAASKSLGFDVDFKALRQHFVDSCGLVRIFYYSAILEGERDDFVTIRPLLDWLDYNGFTVVTKPAKEFIDALGRRKIKGNMDLDLAVDMLESASFLDHIILFSGDGDFRRVIEAVQRKGVKVSVVSSLRTQPPMVADELRRQADQFVELQSVVPLIARTRAPLRATA